MPYLCTRKPKGMAKPYAIHLIFPPNRRADLLVVVTAKPSFHHLQDKQTNTNNREMETTQPKRISITIRWARAHKGMIYDVLDPELRSQTCNFRNKPMVEA